ncbi:unnamed protein product [Kuraishia capsulata CBS 1993]|uniref:Uncharacterized protein n=1 Tax=Kuraishia capsulata CBS 1993 TaxID=1382522 RepID=W6MS02_9ASCO|nr:uncharacterized protein KUCA_T00005160001 [Kuraishia capsulata CBS 1993]CDK29173.1 unnamed protein product [Kuraishia capsulata CBS 1993]
MTPEFLPSDTGETNKVAAIDLYIDNYLVSTVGSPRQCIELANRDVFNHKCPSQNTFLWTQIYHWLLDQYGLTGLQDEELGSELIRIGIRYLYKVRLDKVFEETVLIGPFEGIIDIFAQLTIRYPNDMAYESFRQICTRFEKPVLNKVVVKTMEVFHATENWRFAFDLANKGPITEISNRISIEGATEYFYWASVCCFNALEFETARLQLRSLMTLLSLVDSVRTEWDLFGLMMVNDMLNDDNLAMESAITRRLENSVDDEWVDGLSQSFADFNIPAMLQAVSGKFRLGSHQPEESYRKAVFGLKSDVFSSVVNQARLNKILCAISRHSRMKVEDIEKKYDLHVSTLEKYGFLELPNTATLLKKYSHDWELIDEGSGAEMVRKAGDTSVDLRRAIEVLRKQNGDLVESIDGLQTRPLVLKKVDVYEE